MANANAMNILSPRTQSLLREHAKIVGVDEAKLACDLLEMMARDARALAKQEKDATMTTKTDQGSAKIYQFPLRGRFAASIHGDDAKASPMLAPQAVNAALGGGWYHDEAILEAERARKN
jgi:hypothetical protein